MADTAEPHVLDSRGPLFRVGSRCGRLVAAARIRGGGEVDLWNSEDLIDWKSLTFDGYMYIFFFFFFFWILRN